MLADQSIGSEAISAKQERELQLSIIAYLSRKGYKMAAQSLVEETGLEFDQKYSGMLEKKWTVAIMLQKKILSMEAATHSKTAIADANDTLSVVPSSKHKFELDGHKSAVTKVAFHPSQSVIASGKIIL